LPIFICLRFPYTSIIEWCYGKDISYDDLKASGVPVDDMYTWHAPIDIIDNYQAFLEGHITFVASRERYCNCTDPPWFGSNCEYTLTGSSVNDTIFDIIQQRFQMKQINDIKTAELFERPNSTCYTELFNEARPRPSRSIKLFVSRNNCKILETVRIAQ
jgi:hypothetical protein